MRELHLIAAALIVLLVACTGVEGDPCNEVDDCNGGLVCCRADGTTGPLSERGRCQSTCSPTVRTDSGGGGMCTPGDGSCGAGNFCDGPTGDCTGAGVCAAEPMPGDCDATSEMVCGCDGTTYMNRCEAQLADVRVAASGACMSMDGGPTDAGQDASIPADAGTDAGAETDSGTETDAGVDSGT